MTHDLDDLFALAKAQTVAVVPSDALIARVLADGAREQPRTPRSPPAAPVRFWMRVSAWFGGGGMLAGMGTAMVAGLYLGFAQPVALLQLTDAFVGMGSLDSVDLMPGVDALLSEE